MRPAPFHRPAALFGITAALAIAAVGCGDDDTEIGTSKRGSGSDTEGTTVENAFIVPTFLPGRCAIQLDTGAKMRFTVTNGHPTETERLLSVTTNATADGEVDAGVEIPAEATVGFGQPSAPAVDDGGSVPALEIGELDPSLRPGMSADVTFRFDRAGDIEMPVQVEACPTQER